MTKKTNIEFEDMNLQVGVRLQIMQTESANPVVQYSSLIGFVADEYLLLKMPQEGMENLKSGSAIMIRVFSGVSVYTFAAKVLQVQQKPFASLYLSFPREIQKVGLRKAVRVKADLPVKIKSTSDPAVFKMATLSDISLTGALVSTARPLGAAGDAIQIEFSLRDESANADITIATGASIRSVQQSAGSTADGMSFHTVYSHGINFQDLSASDQAVLQNFVYQTLLIHRN